YEYPRSDNVGKHFDKTGTSLAWNAKRKYLYCLLCESNVLHKIDCEEWLKGQYPDEKTLIPEKQCINFGKGTVLFLLGHHRLEDGSQMNYDLCHVKYFLFLNVVEGKTIAKVTIETSIFAEKKAVPQYWGFRFNEKFNYVSVLVAHKDEEDKNKVHHQVLLVSLHGGKIVWTDIFQYVHDMSFSDDGTFLAIFERPRDAKLCIVLHVRFTCYLLCHKAQSNRLSHLIFLLCKKNKKKIKKIKKKIKIKNKKLEYGGIPLGWDGFTWCGDSLVFIAPYKMSVLSAEELLALRNKATHRTSKHKISEHDKDKDKAKDQDQDQDKNKDKDKDKEKENEKEKQHVAGLDEEQSAPADTVPQANKSTTEVQQQQQQQQQSTDDSVENRVLLTDFICLFICMYRDLGPMGSPPLALTNDLRGQLQEDNGNDQRKRDLCVGNWQAMVGLRKKNLNFLTNVTMSDNVAKLILEYADLCWAILQFPFPKLDDDEEHLKSAMTEVLKSGFIGSDNYLMLSKMGRDPKTKMVFNHWVFYLTKIPNSFGHMWNVAINDADSLGGIVKVGALGSQDKEMPEIFQKK
ncbi:hypothetical protein RFI_06044, partial [Reticulomyxa filosa]